MLIIRSIPRAQLNITGVAGSFGEGNPLSVIDFGVAESGETRGVFIQVRANTVSQLSISSEHQGFLIHKDTPDTAQPISYEARLEDELLDLTGIVIKEYDLPLTYEGRSLAFDLTLGNISGAMAGDYEDTITIEFSPL